MLPFAPRNMLQRRGVGVQVESAIGLGLSPPQASSHVVSVGRPAQRELRTRYSFETSALQLEEENSRLREASAQMSSDLAMLKDTIGAVGDKGDQWIGQLRVLYLGQKRENDRHSMLLRGHARIVLLQLIQHFDCDHSMRLNTGELRAAEAFLTAGFPDINVRHLEEKAASSGVTIADLEPLLLQHLEHTSAITQLEVQQPQAQSLLLSA